MRPESAYAREVPYASGLQPIIPELTTEADFESLSAFRKPIRVPVSGFARYSNSPASLRPSEQAKLHNIARLIVESMQPGARPILMVTVVGHADRDLARERREPGFMTRISRERALATQQALQRLINNPRISSRVRWRIHAVGGAQPVVFNPSNEMERRRNRRVVIVLWQGAHPVPPSPQPQPQPRPSPRGASDVSPGFVSAITPVRPRNSTDVNDFYRLTTGSEFVDWFNNNIARRGSWSHLHLGHPGDAAAVKTRFNRIWDLIPDLFGMASINLVQFLSLMSIIINETGGTLLPVSERVGRPGHPGIAYAFDAIPKVKASYNSGSNRTALDLFNDPEFLAAHGHLPLAERVRNTRDVRWAGHRYPQEDFPTSTVPAVSGIILEADFYKFRGRGLIQTTFRAAYKHIIEYIQASGAAHPITNAYQRRWAGMSSERVASISTNDDWDRLFQQTDLVIPAVAIRLHNQRSGNYLAMPLDAVVLSGTKAGSIWNVGRRVSGSGSYANLFRARVMQILNAMGNGTA
jgi:hypothetical protein